MAMDQDTEKMRREVIITSGVILDVLCEEVVKDNKEVKRLLSIIFQRIEERRKRGNGQLLGDD